MAAMAPERSRTLHNFSLPPHLTWGAQKLLRCAKLNNNNNNNNNNDDDVVADEPNRKKRRNSSFLSPPSIRRVSPSSAGDDDQIEVMREKLMLDLRSEVDKMRAAILGPPQPPPETRPWNLRTRRAACKDPISSPIRVRGGSPANYSPAAATSDAGGEAPRAKFSVALSRREIEDDFLEMVGRRPPRKPKKRPRYVQKQMDTLFPGLWLSEITADMYKVDENPEPPK